MITCSYRILIIGSMWEYLTRLHWIMQRHWENHFFKNIRNKNKPADAFAFNSQNRCLWKSTGSAFILHYCSRCHELIFPSSFFMQDLLHQQCCHISLFKALLRMLLPVSAELLHTLDLSMRNSLGSKNNIIKSRLYAIKDLPSAQQRY